MRDRHKTHFERTRFNCFRPRANRVQRISIRAVLFHLAAGNIRCERTRIDWGRKARPKVTNCAYMVLVRMGDEHAVDTVTPLNKP